MGKWALSQPNRKSLVDEGIARTIARRKIGFCSDNTFGKPPTNMEIRTELNLSKRGLESVLKSPIFEKVYNEEISAIAGRNRLEALRVLGSEMLNSIQTIIDIRDDEAVSPTVRLRAATQLLDVIKVEKTGDSSATEEDELRAFLRKTPQLNININTGGEKKDEPSTVVIDGSSHSVN